MIKTLVCNNNDDEDEGNEDEDDENMMTMMALSNGVKNSQNYFLMSNFVHKKCMMASMMFMHK